MRRSRTLRTRYQPSRRRPLLRLFGCGCCQSLPTGDFRVPAERRRQALNRPCESCRQEERR